MKSIHSFKLHKCLQGMGMRGKDVTVHWHTSWPSKPAILCWQQIVWCRR